MNKPEEVVRVGDVFNMRIVKIEADQRRLGLSIKEFVEATGEDALINQAPIPEEPVVNMVESPEVEPESDEEDAATDDSPSTDNESK